MVEWRGYPAWRHMGIHMGAFLSCQPSQDRLPSCPNFNLGGHPPSYIIILILGGHLRLPYPFHAVSGLSF
jgi:hypothetical protein